MKDDRKISIVIPVYCNEDTLEILYEDLKKTLQGTESYEIIMVDDGSLDHSWDIMQKIYRNDPSRIRLIKLSRNFGSHSAMLAGLLEATGDCAVVKAADMQEDSALILEMKSAWEKGNSVVLAVRKDREESCVQKFFAGLYYGLIRKMVNKRMPKSGFDIFLIDRKVIEVLRLLDENNSAITLQILWAGFKTEMIYYIRRERKIGKSKWTLAKKIKLIVDSVMSFSYVPIRFMTAVGGGMFLLSVVWTIFLFIKRLMGEIPIQGWTTLTIVVLASAGMIMLMLGILGEYMWRCLDASRNRPSYIIEEKIETSGEKEISDDAKL